MFGLPHKTKQFFFVLIKLSIVVAAFYFIYDKLTNNNGLKFSVFADFVSKNGVFSLKNFTILLFLSIFNWFFEILKWKNLVTTIKKTSLIQATEQSLGALTASLFTPNRIGEYGAKTLYFKSGQRKRIMLINLIGNVLQMAVTIVFGAIGLYYFTNTYRPEINYNNLKEVLIIALVVFALVGFAAVKSNLSIKGFSVGKIRVFIKKFPTHRVGLGLLFSVLRYTIFSFQFYFLLQLFNVDLTYFEAIIIISSMYLLASVIPSIFIFDVLIKGSVAVYLFAFANVNSLLVLNVITLMWIFNFVLPSILGSYYVLKFKPKTANLNA